MDRGKINKGKEKNKNRKRKTQRVKKPKQRKRRKHRHRKKINRNFFQDYAVVMSTPIPLSTRPVKVTL